MKGPSALSWTLRSAGYYRTPGGDGDRRGEVARSAAKNHRRPNAAFVSGFNQAIRMGIAAGRVQQVNMATMIAVRP